MTTLWCTPNISRFDKEKASAKKTKASQIAEDQENVMPGKANQGRTMSQEERNAHLC